MNGPLLQRTAQMGPVDRSLWSNAMPPTQPTQYPPLDGDVDADAPVEHRATPRSGGRSRMQIVMHATVDAVVSFARDAVERRSDRHGRSRADTIGCPIGDG